MLLAILKAADVCGTAPEQAAQFIVDNGCTPRYDCALQVSTDWRFFNELRQELKG
jgi:hypothetical protein